MTLSWRVYLEPVAGYDLREVWEYAVAKKGGFVFRPTRLTVSPTVEPTKADSVAATNEAEAIAVAKKDADRVSDLAKKQLTVCELSNFWRIITHLPYTRMAGDRNT